MRSEKPCSGVLYRGKPNRKKHVQKKKQFISKWLNINIIGHSARIDAGLYCAAPRALIHQLRGLRRRGRLWAVLEFCNVGKNCRAVTLIRKFYVWLGEFLGTGEKEELRSDNQEEKYVDGAG